MIQELKNIAEQIIKENNLASIEIKVKRIQRGRANFMTRKISIPYWAIQEIREYAIYYLIHELTHFISEEKFNNYGHNKLFKKLETSILRKYNIIPEYSKAYPKALYNPQGVKLCGKYGKVVGVRI